MAANGKFNIGVVLPRENSGGQFQLALSIADSLLAHSNKHSYTIIYFERHMLDWLVNASAASGLVPVEKRTEWQRVGTLVNLMLHTKVLPMAKRTQLAVLAAAKIDLLIIPFHGMFGYMHGLPYVITITSIVHKGHAKSPVKLSFKERLFVDVLYRYASRNAVFSVVDSSSGMSDLGRAYGIPSDKMKIVPYMPAGYIYRNANMGSAAAEQILSRFALPETFLLYPAQFWYVKNHDVLVRALKLAQDRYNIRIPLVLVGHAYEAYEKVMALVKDLDMQDQVFHLGYVSDKEIVALYKKSVALVYPSLAGPTNLPPVEAMVLGTPVLCSNLFAMPEQVGDAGLLFDPFNIDDMAEKIYQIWTDPSLRESLKQKGYEKVKDLTQENYARQWEGVIDEALRRIGKTA